MTANSRLGIALRARQRQQAGLDDVGKQRDEDGAEQRAEQRAHAADDHHRDVLDGEEQRERLDRDEAAVVGEQRARHRGDRRADDEGEQLVAGDVDAERLGDGLVRADRAPGAPGARAQQVERRASSVAAAAASSTKYQARPSVIAKPPSVGGSITMPVEKPRRVSYSPPR